MEKNLVTFLQELTRQDTKNLTQKALKTCEEVGELARKVLPYENAFATNHRFIGKSKILEEVADVILTVLSIGYDLGYTQDEIEQMIYQKALKWQSLQIKEANLKYPIPFEIHITVQLKPLIVPEFLQKSMIDVFRSICSNLHVKPIILELQTKASNIQDVMTSSKFFGTNTEALQEMSRISQGLQANGLTVIREKIETVPWHPAAPKNDNDVMPPGCYFECHFNILVDDLVVGKLREIAELTGSHLSRNVYKRINNEQYTIMMTYRSYVGTYEQFKLTIDRIKQKLTEQGFGWEKEIVEFSIYDTRVSHDAEWLKSN